MYQYRAKVLRVVDGDTVDVEIDLGFAIGLRERCRLVGIDAPESRTKDLEEKARGIAATKWLEKWVLGKSVIIETEKDTRGKFGRYLVKIYLPENMDTSINQKMITEGYAKEYKL